MAADDDTDSNTESDAARRSAADDGPSGGERESDQQPRHAASNASADEHQHDDEDADGDQPSGYAADDRRGTNKAGSRSRHASRDDADDAGPDDSASGDSAHADEHAGEDGDEAADEAAGEADEGELVGVGAGVAGAESVTPAGEEPGSSHKSKKGRKSKAERESEEDRESDEDSAQGTRKRQKKDHATPKQRSGAEQPKRTTPAAFVRGSVGELRKVVYPTRAQLGNYFIVVLVFVLLVIAIVSALDYGFGAVIVKVFS